MSAYCIECCALLRPISTTDDYACTNRVCGAIYRANEHGSYDIHYAPDPRED